MRGGSWNNDTTRLRCDARNNNNPDNRNNNNGFRVLAVPAESFQTSQTGCWYFTE
ncbi:SUMF1/EgtB/PvdO family nonheme iron enzyme [candidate division KSB1 bacterium]|nr:SUMF1/EgtB/PvdO family nonheme iron enzyme [candidate division KSB1 bacterium]